MADAAVFDFVSAQLETRTSLDRLSARGTLRIALKQAGLDSAGVTPEQMAVVLERVLPGELAGRGIANAGALCQTLAVGARGVAAPGSRETPDAVFRRLGEVS